MRKKIRFSIIGILTLFIAALIPVGLAKWDLMGKPIATPITPTATDTCYILKDSVKYYFPTIESAVKAASDEDGSQLIYVTPTGAGTVYIKESIKLIDGDVLILPYNGTTYKTTKDNYKDVTNDSFSGASKKSKVVLREGKQILLDGGSLIVGGAVGRNSSAGLISFTAGSYSELILENNANITIKSTTKNSSYKELECHGYIRRSSSTGNAYIDALTGKILTPFVVYDAKGGNNTSSLVSDKIFPFYVYDFPNLEIDYTIHHGASLLGIFRIPVKALGFIENNVDAEVALVGSKDAIFTTSENSYVDISFKPSVYATPTTDALSSKGTTQISLYGSCALSRVIIDVGTEVDSANFFLPISYRFAIQSFPIPNVNTTLILDNKLIFLSGSSLIIHKDINVVINKSIYIQSKDYSVEATVVPKYTNAIYPYAIFTNGADIICNGQVIIGEDGSNKIQIGGVIKSTEAGAKLDFTNLYNDESLSITICVSYGASGETQNVSINEKARGLIDQPTGELKDFSNTLYDSILDTTNNIVYWKTDIDSARIQFSFTLKFNGDEISSGSEIPIDGGTVSITISVDITPKNSDYTLTCTQTTTNSITIAQNSNDKNQFTITFPDRSNVNGDLESGFKITATHSINGVTPAEKSFTLKQKGKTSSGGTCVIGETQIILSNGQTKLAKDIVAGDELLVFNHETGKFDVSPVIFNDIESEALYDITYLYFSNGEKIGLSYEHGFFDKTLNKYAYITKDNADEYIGHTFYSLDGDITLVKQETVQEYVKLYSPVTAYHLNYFTNNVLSMPGGITGLFNMFEYEPDTLKYNEEAKQNDIEKYGLFTYKDFRDYCSYEFYSAFPAPYLKVSIGKGLVTFDQLMGYIERYSKFFE